MNTEEKIKRSRDAVEHIKEGLIDNILKDYRIEPLIKWNTEKVEGHVVVMELSTKFCYFEDELSDWKEKLGAYKWCFRVWRNTLYLRFIIYYEDK